MANRKIKNIWFVSREYDGLAGAGGVKDVCRQLAEALGKVARVSVILPCYGFLTPKLLGFNIKTSLLTTMNYADQDRQEEVVIWGKKTQSVGRGEVTIYLVDALRFREKLGVYTYTEAEEELDPFKAAGSGHYDYFAMNVLLQKAALCYLIQRHERPDIIHCHDGHTALVPPMAREIDGFRHFFRNTGFVVTIHNAGLGYHQEVADLPYAQAITGLPRNFINKNLLDGAFDPFVAASRYCKLNTVSENYARELRESDEDELTGWLGHFLMSRGIKIEGITNGINPADFDTTEPDRLGLAAPFSVGKGDLAGKAACRRQLEEMLAHKKIKSVRQHGYLEARPELPLLTVVGRFSGQKGMDKLVAALHRLLPAQKDFQILIQGSGDRRIAQALISLTRENAHSGRICVLEGYDPLLANKIYAAGDFFIIPSQYEPCGLTDYIAQLFGNLPIVHHIGGLVKVLDNKTGFAYRQHSTTALIAAIKRALAVYHSKPQQIRAMQKRAVQTIAEQYTWDKVMLRYQELYREALCKE
ncbi:MAG: glycogen synthase [Desulfobulbaceae bacterium]|nr:MAG: glycogen synthase [Desulfobulbaceae bacterium]